MQYSLDLIEARAKEKYDRIVTLINLLGTCPDNNDYKKRLEKDLGAELCTSIQSSENLCELQNVSPYYQYNEEGGCYFMVDGIEVMVADLRDMRGDQKYFDICVPVIDYKEDDIWIQHVIPDCWLYGSRGEEFDDFKPVHEEFLNAARQYIIKYKITKEMQEDDEE